MSKIAPRQKPKSKGQPSAKNSPKSSPKAAPKRAKVPASKKGSSRKAEPELREEGQRGQASRAREKQATKAHKAHKLQPAQEEQKAQPEQIVQTVTIPAPKEASPKAQKAPKAQKGKGKVQAKAQNQPKDPESGNELPEPILELTATLYTMDQLRQAAIIVPQLALVGRSNVGKSSLLNALARRRSLAKISSTPGKTRSINLFTVQPDGFCLTDLPGYGYARRSKSERQAWGQLIESYLRETPLLCGVVLLLDCRIPPQESDKLMASFTLSQGLPLIPILTKSDKCSQRERSSRQRDWAPFLRGKLPLPVSARSGLGLGELWARLRASIVWPEEVLLPDLEPDQSPAPLED